MILFELEGKNPSTCKKEKNAKCNLWF